VLLGASFPAAPAGSIGRISCVVVFVVVEMGPRVFNLAAWFEE
jgi:hypothetical protein